jgi:predicted metal-dependent phosphoesterase TrpH
VIDLHLHTTASDGRCGPMELVRRARDAGVTALSVTDHDTVAALAEVRALCAAHGIEFVSGIEVTSVWEGRDVHVLGYFFDEQSPAFEEFLIARRRERVARIRAMAARLGALGAPIEIAPIVEAAAVRPDHSVGRPQIARALVSAGHTADTREAFDRLIGEGRPAFVPRTGPLPAEVVALIARAGGIASLAHPGLLGRDDLIPDLARRGLAAIEAYHSEHPAEAIERYRALARAYGLAISGGSDYHGEGERDRSPGTPALPREDFETLKARAGKR